MALNLGSKVFIDTAPIIYFIEEHPLFSSFPTTLFEKMENDKIEVVTSTLTLTEVLTMPYKLERTDIAEIYKDFFFNSKGFTIWDLTADISEIAAKIRAEFGFKTPDAIQLATFQYLNCDFFVTNDIQLKRYNKNAVIVLSDLYNEEKSTKSNCLEE
ncbi:UNVERIFIED_CONTAM: putative nucleic acid-binding protein [Acetivibrio alkalicellulosi]